MSDPTDSHTPQDVHAGILAGGRSSRMGLDKADVFLGMVTLLEITRRTLSQLGIHYTVIREDVVPKCGPLGGIITALQESAADRILVLPCDMPFVGTELIGKVINASRSAPNGACAWHDDLACFPMCINRAAQPTIRSQYDAQQYSLQKLVKCLELTPVVSLDPEKELFNINTKEDLRRAVSIQTS